MNLRRILTSLLVIGVVSAAGVGASRAFFSDTETSSGNSFEAGDIDLEVSGSFNSTNNGGVFNTDDLDENKSFYTFEDLKPGDTGGGQFTFTAGSNDYYACVRTTLTSDLENELTEPEVDLSDDTSEGELDNYLTFAFWNDSDGDGEYDAGEPNLVGPWLENGLIPWIPNEHFTVGGQVAAGWVPLADNSPASFFSSGALVGDSTHHLGMAYCFGEMNPDLTCPGNGSQNNAQTDILVGSMEFYAVQARNNDGFLCSSLDPAQSPVPTIQPIVTNAGVETGL